MGDYKDWAELAERLGANSADFQDSLSEEARQVACTIWRDFPDFVSANADLSRSFVRGYMSRLCSDGPLPQLDPPPFSGGQCDGVLYDVTISRSVYNISNCLEVVSGSVVISVLGPVQGIVKQVVTPAQTTTSCNGLAADPVDLSDWFLLSGSPDFLVATGTYTDPNENANPPLSNFTITNVVRNDGQPDLCGDLPLAYPPTSPNIPGDFTIQRNLTIEDGVDLVLNFFYNTNLGTFPMNFDLNGIKIVLDLGGVNFYYAPTGNNGSGGTLPGGQPSPLPAPNDNLDIKYPPPVAPPPNNTDYDEEEKTETDPKEEDVGEELAFVRVELTSIPSNARNQFGDGAPDVYYAGWFEFQAEGYNFPRQPIHFIDNVYRKPIGATGYAYTLYNGFLGKATIYKLKQEA